MVQPGLLIVGMVFTATLSTSKKEGVFRGLILNWFPKGLMKGEDPK